MSAPENDPSNNKTILFGLFLVALYVSFYLTLSINTFSDDSKFLTAATSGASSLSYLLERYYTWTGRIAIEGIMYETIATPAFWKLAIPSFLLLSSYSIWKSFFSDKIDFAYGIPLCMFGVLIISHPILDTTVFYVTGFYNYLLPVACGLFASALFVKPSSFSTPEKILAIPLAFIASQSEQVGISMIAIFATSLIWDRRNQATFRTLLALIVIAGFALLITAPGNYLRLTTEAVYMPEFTEYSFIRKVLNGFDIFNAHYIDPMNLYPKIIALLLVLLTMGKTFELKRTALILTIGGIFQGSILSFLFTTGNDDYYSIRNLNSGFGLNYFFSYALSISSLISATYLMKRSLATNSSFYIGTLLLLLHTGVTAVVGLSPTAYESGYRVLLVGDIIILMLTCLLLRNVTWPNQHKPLTCKVLSN
ncbi:hypothetical protein HT737_06700 [Pseudomonas sp. MD195_PC81_125]|uniref:hypothetical protein n=1 Tax=Pseudomonas sp. MD195_PC81_125 TaxID=2741560 RepID=UPI0015FADDD4|nr:hypothetical protein [Pseudomonas sp. MD195_PC81_125]MBA5979750.1 hypothetical protein [Pseudomonas sp. MD195_PC81_125]